ncbi:MAG: RimK family protein [Gemmatimonadota bacterium]|nr:RimK family protein [Gemmatimonadota bacterium]
MKKIVVVANPKLWTIDAPGCEVVAARDYLLRPELGNRSTRVFNLCREYRYGSQGYYVSLLAEARGQRVMPSVKTIQDLKTPAVTRILTEELDDLVRRSLRELTGTDFELDVYFGETPRKEHERLALELHRLFPAPFFRARFERDGKWELRNVRILAFGDIEEADVEYARKATARYLGRRRYHSPRTNRFVYDLAILHDPEEKAPPSDRAALNRFVSAGEALGFSTELITREDSDRIGEFDALLIRATTEVDHYTYRFARRAQSEGMPVIDDPDSILRCTNKVYLAEALHAAGVPTPRTLIVHKENQEQVLATIGLPCVLKVPDGSFSLGVTRAEDAAGLVRDLERMLTESELVIAQAYTPTPFDWRVGVLDGQPLFVCRYFMASGHWQIYNWKSQSKRDVEGDWETLPVEAAPVPVVNTALRAAALMGDGLYGVDLKEVDGQPMVIEVNDNPNVDHGVEDQVLGDELYRRVVATLRDRFERKFQLRGV